MGIREEVIQIADQALQASRELVALSTATKNKGLEEMAKELDAARAQILAANAEDVDAAKKKGLSAAMIDRLTLNDARIDAMIKGLREVAALSDPVGEVIQETTRPNGLKIRKVRVPIGVIGFIYESRPNVTSDSASLCVKAGNAVILRGGSEALRSNRAVVKALQVGAKRAGLPAAAVQLIDSTDRAAVTELVQCEGKVDLIIPRGGESLIRAVVENAKIPVIKHYKGLCAIYVDESADEELAVKVVENAKCSRPGVCNAAETLLVSEKIAASFLPKATKVLRARGVELRGDERARAISAEMIPATNEDWHTEFLDLKLAVKVVKDVGEAIAHINAFGSHLAEAIITKTDANAMRFTTEVDSAAVYVNTSTRFTDGGEYGMGAEIGISSDKFHARGPMGLAELTTYKYVVHGSGQIRT